MSNERLEKYKLLSTFTQTEFTITYLARRDPDALRLYLVLSAERPHQLSKAMRQASRLAHPNLCKVVEHSEDNEAFFVATEVEGEPLPRLVERIRSAQGSVPTPIIFFIASEICAGLGYALHHEDGPLLHGALRPEMLFVSSQGRVSLYGVGSVAESDRYDRAQLVARAAGIINFSYLSPEAARGRRTDTRSDIFSLGSVLYELLSGRRPFAAESPLQTIVRIIQDQPEPLRQVAPGLPEEAYQTIEKMMRNKIEERYEGPNLLKDELSGYLAELGGKGLRFDLGALVRLFRGSWLPPYGPYSGYLLRELGRLSKASWLSPDPELESESAEAKEWLEQRLDEHISALSPLVGDPPMPPVKVRITRSILEAKRLFEAAQFSGSREILSWRRSLSILRKRTEELCRCVPQLKAAFEAVSEEALAMAAPSEALPGAHRQTLSFWWESNEQNPAAELVKAHASFLLIFGELPSPWAPLLSIWERGAWPLAFSEEGFLIYLPVLHRETLVPEPKDPSSSRGLPVFTPLF